MLKLAEAEWARVLPSVPFDYYFLDDQFAQLYENEDRLTGAIGAFSIVAIIIASLGLLGLSSLITTQRTKEIGIRKVLGASVSSIVKELTRSFALLVLIAFVVSVPLAFWVLNGWLNDFAYKTDIGILVFALALLCTFLVAILTIGIQTINAATKNPVTALRSE